MKKLLILLAMMSLNAYSSIPTLEGLLRNPGSGEVAENTVVLKVMVEEVLNNKILQTNTANVENTEVANQLEDKKIKPVYLKMIYSLEKENVTQLLQVRYSGNSMSQKDIENIVHIDDLKTLSLAELDVEKNIFYGLTTMFALNDSSVLSQMLKKHNPEYKTNQEVMNQDKLKLLEDYKRYLQAVKDEEALKEEIPSPLKPEDPEETIKVKELLAMPMYNKSEQIEMSRKDGKFYWEVKLQNFTALFMSDSHKLTQLNFHNNEKSMEFIFGNYVLFDGAHHLPKIIFWKDFEERLFKIRILSMNVFNSDKKKLHQRVTDYEKMIEENVRKAAKKEKKKKVMAKKNGEELTDQEDEIPDEILPNFLYQEV